MDPKKKFWYCKGGTLKRGPNGEWEALFLGARPGGSPPGCTVLVFLNFGAFFLRRKKKKKKFGQSFGAPKPGGPLGLIV